MGEVVIGTETGGEMPVGYEDVAGPPLHPNCLIGETPVLAPDKLAGLVATYNGPVIELTFADSRRLTVTPNHMLLSPQGFVKGGVLHKGSYVLDCPAFERIIARDPNHHGQPTRIDDAVKAFSESLGVTTRRVPVASEYLHGDAVFSQGYIDIIASNRLVDFASKSSRKKHFGAKPVGLADIMLSNLISERNLAAMLLCLAPAADSIVSRRSLSASFSGGHLGCSKQTGGGTTSDFDASFEQPPIDGGAAHVEPARERLRGFSGKVALAERLNVQVLHPVLSPFSNALKPIQIMAVRTYHYTGKVYDLSTTSTLYLANGIVSSNCECTLVPVLT